MGHRHESEFCPVSRIHFANSELHLEVEPNVSCVPTKITTITGRAV